jgi:hypothetical protein
MVVVSSYLPRLEFITAESDEARKSATVAIPGTLCVRLKKDRRTIYDLQTERKPNQKFL